MKKKKSLTEVLWFLGLCVGLVFTGISFQKENGDNKETGLYSIFVFHGTH